MYAMAQADFIQLKKEIALAKSTTHNTHTHTDQFGLENCVAVVFN